MGEAASIAASKHIYVARCSGMIARRSLLVSAEYESGSLPDVIPDPAHYEQLAADRAGRTGSVEDGRLVIAREHGFRTWWRLLAAIDAARKAMLPIRPLRPEAEWKDYQRETRDLLKGARAGVPSDIQRFRDRMLRYANATDDHVSATVTLGYARYVLGEEYGGRDSLEYRVKAAKETSAQTRAWIERFWEDHDRLRWSARTRAEMTPKQQEFVEAAMGDWGRLDQVASLPRLQSMLAEDSSLIETAGPAALARALYWRKGEPIVRFLLDKGVRLDHPPGIFGPVHEAVWQNRVESVRMVLEAGGIDAAQVAIEPPHGGLSSHRSLLHISAWLSFVEMTELLLQHGAARTIEARLDETGDTAMHRALEGWLDSDPFAERDPNGIPNHRSGREIVALLLEYGAYYDIHSACRLNDADRVRELLVEDLSQAGLPHGAGYTPLHLAARGAACDCAALLLDAGADVNADTNSLVTPLHRAASVDVSALLIERGADVDAQDAKGRTPLFLACQAGAADIAEFLIVLGAKTTIRNDKGKSPLDVATQACIYMKPNRK
jgi:hypothetical protein